MLFGVDAAIFLEFFFFDSTLYACTYSHGDSTTTEPGVGGSLVPSQLTPCLFLFVATRAAGFCCWKGPYRFSFTFKPEIIKYFNLWPVAVSAEQDEPDSKSASPWKVSFSEFHLQTGSDLIRWLDVDSFVFLLPWLQIIESQMIQKVLCHSELIWRLIFLFLSPCFCLVWLTFRPFDWAFKRLLTSIPSR